MSGVGRGPGPKLCEIMASWDPLAGFGPVFCDR